MGFRYDMRNKSPQQQAIVRQRDEEDRKRREVSDVNKEKESRKPIKETKYCKIWERVTKEMSSGGVAAIELITVKDINKEEVRFVYYKKEGDTLRMIPRPLDIPLAELNSLLTEAYKKGIINKF